MAGSRLFDSDVLIWASRGHAGAMRIMLGEEKPAISVVTYMEVAQGTRNAREQRVFREFIEAHGIASIPLSENIGHRATIYIEEHALGQGLRMADALIAATAAETGRTLCTGNARNISRIKDLQVEAFRA